MNYTDQDSAKPKKLLSKWCPDWVSTLSGWNWTPYKFGKSLCRSPIIVPSSNQAVISRQSGKLSRSTIRLWYLVATNGWGNSEKSPFPLCKTWDVFPCISSLALTIFPPKVWAIAWWPRQTPKIGLRLANSLKISRHMPDWSGSPGPGDRTIAVSYTHLRAHET